MSENITTTTNNTVQKEDLINTVHEALNTFNVQIYNGQEQPITVSLPQGITNISKEVKAVKVQLAENTDLLSGIRQRNLIFKYISNIFEILRKTKTISIIKKIITSTALLYGLAGLLKILGIIK